MKKYILIVVLILFSQLNALDFYDISFDQAIKFSQKEKKLIFLMVDEEGCPWCIKMKNISLKNQEVEEILGSDYISIKINKYSNDLDRKYKTRFVPTMFIIDPNGVKELNKVVGFISAESLYDMLFIASRFND